MRYLKRFNEDYERYEIQDKPQWFEELKDFSEGSLAYLLDEGYEIDLSYDANTFPEPSGFCASYEGSTGVIINLYNLDRLKSIRLESGAPSGFCTWAEIKEYYIPFLKLLSKKYKLLHFTFFTDKKDKNRFICAHGDNYQYFTLEDFVNDKIDDNYLFFSISVKVVDEL